MRAARHAAQPPAPDRMPFTLTRREAVRAMTQTLAPATLPGVERRARCPWFGLFAAFTVAMMNSGTVVRSAAAPRR